jgi:hypothetical protein
MPLISAWHYFHSYLKRFKEGQQKLPKKGWGWLIHVSDFVEEENGCYRLDKWLNCLAMGVTPPGSAVHMTRASVTL